MKVLIVDDDRTLVDILAFTFRREGFETVITYDSVNALKTFQQEDFDIIILDVNLPGDETLVDGFALCHSIRKISTIPIILLTVRDEESDIIKGLELGADDYITKPFSPRQLMARVYSVLRRSSEKNIFHQNNYKHDGVTYDPNRREIIIDNQIRAVLTRLESRLMTYLIINTGQVVPMDNLIDYVWGQGNGSSEMLRQLVRRLRVKIEEDPKNPEHIITFPGIGYGFNT